MSNEKDLLPCPFCGNQNIIIDNDRLTMPPEQNHQDPVKLEEDLSIHGVYITKDGERIDHNNFYKSPNAD